jgi:hypothetical protein
VSAASKAIYLACSIHAGISTPQACNLCTRPSRWEAFAIATAAFPDLRAGPMNCDRPSRSCRSSE